MEKIPTPDDERLLDYLDGVLNEKQSRELEDRIGMSPELKRRLEEFRVLHLSLKGKAVLETPSPFFTQRVMKNLRSLSPATFSTRNGILLLSGILVAIGIALLLLNSGVFDSAKGTVSLESLPIKKEWIKNLLPTIPYNGKMLVNIIIIIATGLSFVLLDRTILRPWFEYRSRVQKG